MCNYCASFVQVNLKPVFMATVSFSFRSRKDKAPLELRLSFVVANNINSKDKKKKPVSFYCRTQLYLERDFWNDYKQNKRFKDVEKVKKKSEVENHLAELSNKVIEEFNSSSLDSINKDWLKRIVNDFYHDDKLEEIPHDLVNYVDYFVRIKKHELKEYNLKRYKSLKGKILEFEDRKNYSCYFKRVNEEFKAQFIEFCEEEDYSVNTYEKFLTRIKTLCRHARGKGIDVSPEFEDLKVKKEKTSFVYLTREELLKVKKLNKLSKKLDTARDWLLISCYTGQRISDFMKFDNSMIESYKEGNFLEFTQQKTKNLVSVPITPPLRSIINKRNGEFPNKLIEQEYNRLIKIVCKKAGMTGKVEGKIKKKIDDKKTQRNVEGFYPKYKLISSHAGRRTFATLYYGHIPTQKLLPITGHKTEKMLLNYIGKNPYEQSRESLQYLMNTKNIMD